MAAWPFRGNKGDKYTIITSSAVETPLLEGYEDRFANLTQLVLANTSASVCRVVIKDGLAGNTRLVVQVPANDTKVLGNGEDVFLEQQLKGKQWTATCTSVSSMEISIFFKNN